MSEKIHYMVGNKLGTLQFLLRESDITPTKMVLSFKNVIQLYKKPELVLARIKENPLKIFFSSGNAALLRLLCLIEML